MLAVSLVTGTPSLDQAKFYVRWDFKAVVVFAELQIWIG